MEIGSEFEIQWPLLRITQTNHSRFNDFFFGEDNIFLFSGRTAIDYICKDILTTRKIRSVYLPAYCCSSMINPFVNNGINIEFYDIYFNGNALVFRFDNNKSVDIIYLNNYFGFKTDIDIEWIYSKKQNGSIVIYDKTHSLFLKDDPWIDISDYIFCSLRKWFAIASGAVLSKRRGNLCKLNLKQCAFINDKLNAHILKWKYIHDNHSISKKEFYHCFLEFAHKLEQDYSYYIIDDVSLKILQSLDIDRVIERRKQNAQMYYDTLHNIEWLKFMFDRYDNDITPLFIPIIITSAEKRNQLKSMMLSCQIYCPIHWPKSNLINDEFRANEIFDKELSLICDQRYTPKQLKKIVQVIKNF